MAITGAAVSFSHFDLHPFTSVLTNGPSQGADGPDGAALPADYLADVVGRHFNGHRNRFISNLVPYRNTLRAVNKGAGYKFDQVADFFSTWRFLCPMPHGMLRLLLLSCCGYDCGGFASLAKLPHDAHFAKQTTDRFRRLGALAEPSQCPFFI